MKNTGSFFSGVKEEVTHIEVNELQMRENTAQATINVVLPYILTVEMADITDKVYEMKEKSFGQILDKISGDI